MSGDKEYGESQEGGGFVIKDKRRFSSDGEYKGEQSESVHQTADTSSSLPAEEKQKPSPVSPQESSPPKQSSGSKEPSPSDVQFHSLVVSLATQALMLLGEAPSPDGMQVEQDLHAAKQTIDMLIMLQEKTRGNLRDEESRLLVEILRELQMSFVRATQAGK